MHGALCQLPFNCPACPHAENDDRTFGVTALPQAAPANLRFDDVRKIFGRCPALQGASCTFGAGRISLLMGPNGAGKSTLLSIACTLSRPTSGQVFYGELTHAQAEAGMRHRIGLVAHAPMLYGQLSTRENLLFYARMYGVESPEQQVEAWLHRVGLADLAHRPVEQLSRGLAQRGALARALIHDPDLLLLDEPFTGLDRDAVDLLRRELLAAREAGKTVVLVTHDVEAADSLCEQLVVLKRGRVALELSAPPMAAEAILERYHGAI